MDTDEDFNRIAKEYVESQDNTVDLAVLLAFMFTAELSSESMDLSLGLSQCQYFHSLLESYERAIADRLN